VRAYGEVGKRVQSEGRESRPEATIPINFSEVGRGLFWLALHVLIAMGVGTLLGLALYLLVDRIAGGLGFHHSGALGVFSPLLWIGSVLLGALINGRAHHRSACWSGVVGLCCLMMILLIYHTPLFAPSSLYQNPSGDYSLSHGLYLLLSPSCRGGECLEQFLITVPVLNSFAYSLGALLGLRIRSTEAGT